MKVNLQILSKFRLTNADSGAAIPLRSNAQIIAYLAWKGEEATDRKELIRALWPDEDSSVSANRLRVALTRLRGVLNSVLVETRAGLSLDLSQVACDHHEVIESVRDAKANVATKEEMEALAALLPRLSQTLFAFDTDRWQVLAREEWQNWAGTICLRLADLAHQLADRDLVDRAVEAGLNHLPREPKLWVHLLRNADLAGKGGQAIKRLQAAQKLHAIHDPAISQWVEQIQQAQEEAFNPQKRLAPSELEFAGSLIEIIIEKQPDLARQVLGSPDTKASAGRNPHLMHSLLMKVIDQPGERDIHWERCVARTIGLKAWLNDNQGVLDLSSEILAKSKEPIIQRAVWNAVSTAKSLIRDWPGAIEAIDHAISLAEQLGDEVDFHATKGTKATCLWLQGFYKEALDLYEESLPMLRDMKSERAEFEMLMGLGNRAFIPVMQGDFVRGKAWLEDSMAQRQASGLNVPAGLQTSCLAMVKAILGEREGIAALMHQGLIEAFTSDSDRFKLIALEFAAGALIACGESPLGWSILTQADARRKEIRHPRAPAELQLIENLTERIPLHHRRQILTPDMTPAQLGKLAVQRLVKAAGA